MGRSHSERRQRPPIAHGKGSEFYLSGAGGAVSLPLLITHIQKINTALTLICCFPMQLGSILDLKYLRMTS